MSSSFSAIEYQVDILPKRKEKERGEEDEEEEEEVEEEEREQGGERKRISLLIGEQSKQMCIFEK